MTQEALPEACTLNPDGSVSMRLIAPVQFGSELVEEITLRRLRGAEMKTMHGAIGTFDWAQILAAAASLSGKGEHFVDMVDGIDCANIAGVVGYFLVHGPPTGASA